MAVVRAHNPEWLDTADRIGHRLGRQAKWEGRCCTWVVNVAQKVPGSTKVEQVPANGRLYQGTSGIALFLTELYEQTRDVAHRVTAIGAIRHALERSGDLGPGECGLHSGRVGVAYALYRLGKVTQEQEWIDRAGEMLATLPSAARFGSGDVIGGAAGAIPVLLAMSDILPAELSGRLAIQLGDAILRAARYRHIGWSWGGMESFVQDLTGYAHGASGYAHGLLELARATDDEWYRYGAEQALAYERRFFDAQERNWPDFRYKELTEYLGYGHTDALRERLREGQALEPYVKRFMSAWCHGAPGIALTRFRAMEILGGEDARAEALAAAETTNAAVRVDPQGYSLCHGHMGNCETLLVGADAFDRPDWLETVHARCGIGREAFELSGVPWPCGTLQMRNDPSLMLGEAGIGYLYLRAYDRQIPSILCPTPSGIAPLPGDRRRDATVLRQHHTDLYFGPTIRAFERVVYSSSIRDRSASAPGGLTVMNTYAVIEEVISESPPDLRPTLRDIFAVDRARFMLSLAVDDFATEVIQSLARLDGVDIPWATALFRREDHVTILRTQRDWVAWANGKVSPAGDGPCVTVIFWASTRVQTKVVSELAALVLEATSPEASLPEVVERVAKYVEGLALPELEPIVRAQLQAAYGGGLVRISGSRRASSVQ